MWGVLYVAASLAQILAIIDVVPRYLDVSLGVQLIVAFIVAEMPFVGTAAAVYGASLNWDLPVAVGLVLFIWPIVIVLVYLFRYRLPTGEAETTAEGKRPTPEPTIASGDLAAQGEKGSAVDGGSAVMSSWMANVLKNQVEAEEREADAETAGVETPPAPEVVKGEFELLGKPEAPLESADTEIGAATDAGLDATAETDTDAATAAEPDAAAETSGEETPAPATDTDTGGEKTIHDEPALRRNGSADVAYRIAVDHIRACRERVFEKTDAAENAPLRRAVEDELPHLFAALTLIVVPGMLEADLVDHVVAPLLGEEVERSTLAAVFDERVAGYLPELSAPEGTAGYLFARKVGRLGDGLLIRIVNDALAGCRAELSARNT